jgi:hypothetical protein
MEELDFDPNKFAFSYPLWLCVGKGKGNVAGFALGGGRSAVAVFTDQDLAERFITASGARGQVDFVDITDAIVFAKLLTQMKANGASHVVFDDTGKASAVRVVKDIDALLRVIAGKGQ